MYPLHCDLCATSFPDYAAKRQHLLSAAHQAIQSNFLQYKANLGISLFSVLLPKHTDRAEVCTSCCTLFWRPGSLDLHRASYRYVGKQPCGHHNIAHCGNTDWSNAVCKIPKLRRFITMPEDRAEWDAHIASDVHLKNVGSDKVSKIVEHISHALVMTAAEIKEAEGRKDRVCESCGTEIGGDESLEQHRDSHTHKERLWWTCELCSRVFESEARKNFHCHPTILEPKERERCTRNGKQRFRNGKEWRHAVGITEKRNFKKQCTEDASNWPWCGVCGQDVTTSVPGDNWEAHKQGWYHKMREKGCCQIWSHWRKIMHQNLHCWRCDLPFGIPLEYGPVYTKEEIYKSCYG